MDALPENAIVYYMSYDQIAVVFEIPSGEVARNSTPSTLRPKPGTGNPEP